MTANDITVVEEPKRSNEYLKLLKELKQSFISAGEMVIKLYEQGKRDSLPSHIIRKDIEVALDGIIKERRLRELLPLELKRSYTITPENNSAMSAELKSNEHEIKNATTNAIRAIGKVIEAHSGRLKALEEEINKERKGKEWTYEDHRRMAIASWNTMKAMEKLGF
ncbi:MAG: hypothetical protein ACRD8W_07750 [Nitrososphaeraceae archaeon]